MTDGLDASAPGDRSSTAAARRAAALRTAAKAKQQAAVDRADVGLRAMVKAGQPVEFRALARVAGVSVNFLYSHPELRGRVQQLQAQREDARPEPATETSDSAVVRSLTSKLTAERRRRLDEVGLLREQLAAAHGDLLRLRRPVTRVRDADPRAGPETRTLLQLLCQWTSPAAALSRPHPLSPSSASRRSGE